ncbi:MAG: molecular chaperone DnaK, partial [Myxococcota bacterium]
RAIIPINYRGNRMICKVTREEFDRLTADLVEQCADTCQLVMRQAGIQWEQLHEVLLVGGSTRMPMIRRSLSQLSGRRFAADLNPDECVALGAALTGVLRHQPDHPALRTHRRAIARRARQTGTGLQPPPVLTDDGPAELEPKLEGLPAIEISDVTTHPLGMIVLDRQHRERVLTLIKPATLVPCEKRKRFGFAYDNSTAVRVEVTEGTGRTRDEVTVIGEVVLDNLPPRAKGTPLEVLYRYNVNQILEVYVIDVESGTRQRAQINLRGSLKKGRLLKAQRDIAQANVH